MPGYSSPREPVGSSPHKSELSIGARTPRTFALGQWVQARNPTESWLLNAAMCTNSLTLAPGLEQRLDHEPVFALAAIGGMNQAFDFTLVQLGHGSLPGVRRFERQPVPHPLNNILGVNSRNGNLCTLRRDLLYFWESKRPKTSCGNSLVGVPDVIPGKISALRSRDSGAKRSAAPLASGPLERMVCAQHGRVANGVKDPCERTKHGNMRLNHQLKPTPGG